MLRSAAPQDAAFFVQDVESCIQCWDLPFLKNKEVYGMLRFTPLRGPQCRRLKSSILYSDLHFRFCRVNTFLRQKNRKVYSSVRFDVVVQKVSFAPKNIIAYSSVRFPAFYKKVLSRQTIWFLMTRWDSFRSRTRFLWQRVCVLCPGFEGKHDDIRSTQITGNCFFSFF